MSDRSTNHETVLTFHGLGKPGGSVDAAEHPVWISTRSFLALLDAISAREGIRITFDDGNASDFRVALPALLERGLRAEFFIPVDRLGTPGYLGRPELRELADSGMGIGSHGMRHVSWRVVSDGELRKELVGSRERLEDILGGEVRRAACPLGAYDRRVLRAVRAAGYQRVYTSDGGPARANAWMQARTTLLPGSRPEDIERICSVRPTAPSELLRRLKIVIKCLR